ncbi:MAG TPA: dihydrofolate reductase family protein [Anaerolineales bacterium]
MGKLIVNLSVTLDGVTQAPGRPDEDTRNGFKFGGWAGPYFDPVMAQEAGKGMAQQPVLLFGRRTYEDFYKVWPGRTDGNMFTEVLNNAQKYVASRSLKEPLPWMNSTLLKGKDAGEAVAKLKHELGKDILVLGSVNLVRSLMPYHVIDEYALSIHPLLLGTGFRLFNEGSPFSSLRLVDSKTTTTGVVLARYSPKDDGG